VLLAQHQQAQVVQYQRQVQVAHVQGAKKSHHAKKRPKSLTAGSAAPKAPKREALQSTSEVRPEQMIPFDDDDFKDF
jgi:hypothetical protein